MRGGIIISSVAISGTLRYHMKQTLFIHLTVSFITYKSLSDSMYFINFNSLILHISRPKNSNQSKYNIRF